MTRHQIGLPMRVDDHLLHPGTGETVERMVEEGAAAERQERLGGAVGQRPHPGPEAGSEQHGTSDAGRVHSWVRIATVLASTRGKQASEGFF